MSEPGRGKDRIPKASYFRVIDFSIASGFSAWLSTEAAASLARRQGRHNMRDGNVVHALIPTTNVIMHCWLYRFVVKDSGAAQELVRSNGPLEQQQEGHGHT